MSNTGMDALTAAAADGLKKLIEGVSKASEGIGVAAVHIYPALIKAFMARMIGTGIMWTIGAIILIWWSFTMVPWIWHWVPEPGATGKEIQDLKAAKFFIGFVHLIFYGVFVAVLAESFPRILAGIIATEGQFITELVEKAIKKNNR